MKVSRKNVILGVISALTISLTASPAQAAEPVYSDFETNAAIISTQALDIDSAGQTEAIQTQSFEVVVDGISTSTLNNAGHNFDVAKTIATAQAEVGTSRPTGWNMPGECIMSAKRWIAAGGGKWVGSGSPVANYKGAARIDVAAAKPGDIIQYQLISNPDLFATGVHTVLVTGNNPDGTLSIIESNNPAGSGLVQAQKSWTPKPPSGFEAAVWRF